MKSLVLKLKNLKAPKYKGKKSLMGIWEDKEVFLTSLKEISLKGYKEIEAVSPFPMHEIDEILKIKRSFIPYISFIFGLFGCLFGLWFTWWTSSVNWPLIVGGKAFFSLAAFIPVIFELTILFSALSSVFSLFVICGLPKIDPPVGDKDLSSHHFGIFVSTKDPKYDERNLSKLMKDKKAIKVKEVYF